MSNANIAASTNGNRGPVIAAASVCAANCVVARTAALSAACVPAFDAIFFSANAAILAASCSAKLLVIFFSVTRPSFFNAVRPLTEFFIEFITFLALLDTLFFIFLP